MITLKNIFIEIEKLIKSTKYLFIYKNKTVKLIIENIRKI